MKSREQIKKKIKKLHIHLNLIKQAEESDERDFTYVAGDRDKIQGEMRVLKWVLR